MCNSRRARLAPRLEGVPRQKSEWNLEDDWLTNAEAEHCKRPFRAILAGVNPHGHNFVLEGDNVEDSNSLFLVRRTPITPRSSQELTSLIAPVLQCANELLLIDPYFSPDAWPVRNTVKDFLGAAVKGRDVSSLTRVEIHTGSKEEARYFRTEVYEHFPNLVPKGMKVRFVRWSQTANGEQLHNRYILTDRGGVRFGAGLYAGKKGQTDEVERLGDEAYCLRWQQYTSDPVFDLIDQVEIVGKSIPNDNER